jgi:hypothetical protein
MGHVVTAVPYPSFSECCSYPPWSEFLIVGCVRFELFFSIPRHWIGVRRPPFRVQPAREEFQIFFVSEPINCQMVASRKQSPTSCQLATWRSESVYPSVPVTAFCWLSGLSVSSTLRRNSEGRKGFSKRIAPILISSRNSGNSSAKPVINRNFIAG